CALPPRPEGRGFSRFLVTVPIGGIGIEGVELVRRERHRAVDGVQKGTVVGVQGAGVGVVDHEIRYSFRWRAEPGTLVSQELVDGLRSVSMRNSLVLHTKPHPSPYSFSRSISAITSGSVVS
ncbi:hypothetical protein, partial [Sphaerotilus montanus]|uniref:hypothetical protein n=1 Tax=Sphaerotilus montanus TaxID=522889 RepID=UPI003FA24198